MPAPNNLNDRIAKAMRWTQGTMQDRSWYHRNYPSTPYPPSIPTWFNPEGKPAMRPDFTGTLEGVARMMRELGFRWGWTRWEDGWALYEKNHQVLGEGRKLRIFFSADDHPGDCVGEAWLSLFGKEATNDSSE